MPIVRHGFQDDPGDGYEGTPPSNTFLQLLYDDIDANPAAVSWLPILTGSGGASGQAYATQTAVYAVLGQQVVFQGEIQLTALGTITGLVEIQAGYVGTQLPPLSGGANAAIAVGFWAGTTTAFTWLGLNWIAKSRSLQLFSLTAAAMGVGAVAQADLSNSFHIVFAGTYTTLF